jgi:hypothetical protein
MGWRRGTGGGRRRRSGGGGSSSGGGSGDLSKAGLARRRRLTERGFRLCLSDHWPLATGFSSGKSLAGAGAPDPRGAGRRGALVEGVGSLASEEGLVERAARRACGV